MRREIKFRVWEKPIVRNDGTIFSGEMKDIDLYFFEEYDLRDIEDAEDFGYVIMQSTGLIDSNGTEIWEGDVVRGSWNKQLPALWVEYQAPSFVMRYQTPSGRKSASYQTFDIAPDEPQLYEVIGNIHESPDLLDWLDH